MPADWAICIFCIFCILIQNMMNMNRTLLDTLRIHRSNNNTGHILLYSTLLIGHTQHAGQIRVSSCPFVLRKLQQSNRQDMVFIRPPGISDGAFQLRLVLQTSAPVQNPYKDRHWHAVPRVCLRFCAERVQGPTEIRSYFAYCYILCIFWFVRVYRPQPGWISVNLQSSTNAVNKHKSSMWFQFPQYYI